MSESVTPGESDEETNQSTAPIEPDPSLADPTAQALSDAEGASHPDSELDAWRLMDSGQRCTVLDAIIRGKRAVRPEVLVYECIRAHKERSRHMLNLAFEALSKRAGPLLLRQARGLPHHERQSQAQQVLLDLFEAIINGRASFAQNRFAAFAKRRAISLYRKRCARLEGAYDCILPVEEDSELLLDLSRRRPSTEALALLECAEDRLPEKQRHVFIQYHHLQMTQQEIATQYGVSVRTVYNWIKEAEAAIGYSGETHDR